MADTAHPVPPEGFDVASDALRHQGWCLLPDMVTKEEIAALGRELDPIFTATPFCEGDFYGARTKRFGSLLKRSDRVADLIMHPMILALVQEMLGKWCDTLQLNLAQAIEIHPGAHAQFPHRDQDMWQGVKGEVEYLVNVMWPLTPFTRANGATLIYPGTHGARALRNEAPSAVDRLKRDGIGAGLLATLNDMAGLAETTIWNVARRTARVAMRRGPVETWPMEDRFLTAAATAALPMPAGHPWIEAPPGTLPGKRAHVASLIGVQNHLEGHGRQSHAPILSPLLSQPLMELCLAIPSWLWCDSGNNRAIARMAFAGLLPAPVLARRTKGAFEGFCTRLLAANRDGLRVMLLDGALAETGLLDSGAIAACLADPVPRPGDVVRLLMLADVEAWVRAWQARPALPAA